MNYILYSLVLATAVHAHVAGSDPVCIIGAGPAGLSAASKLQERGTDTIIFEKSPEAGGKCQEHYERGHFHPLGALFFSNETYHETLPIINKSGVVSTPFHHTFRNWLYDWKTGEIEEKPLIAQMTSNAVFEEQIERYIKFWEDEFQPHISIGYNNGVEGYTQSTASWLIENKYPHLSILFIRGMILYGYGDPSEVPILYMLQYFTPDIIRFLAGKHEGYIIDFREVWVRYAAGLSSTINYIVNITNIDRREDSPPVITYYQNGESKSQICSKLILAFPPILRALEAANLSLDNTERALFEPVGSIKYWSGAVSMKIPDEFFYTGFLGKTSLGPVPFPPEAAGTPVAFVRLHKDTDIATTWSWGKYRSNQTFEEGRELLIETLSKFNKDPRDESARSERITDGDVKAFKEWDYFAHYDQEQLEQGYFVKFNELQGHRNTYYASGFNGFETVEFAVRAGQDVVTSYFPGNVTFSPGYLQDFTSSFHLQN